KVGEWRNVSPGGVRSVECNRIFQRYVRPLWDQNDRGPPGLSIDVGAYERNGAAYQSEKIPPRSKSGAPLDGRQYGNPHRPGRQYQTGQGKIEKKNRRHRRADHGACARDPKRRHGAKRLRGKGSFENLITINHCIFGKGRRIHNQTAKGWRWVKPGVKNDFASALLGESGLSFSLDPWDDGYGWPQDP